MLYRNDGDGTFTDVTVASGIHEGLRSRDVSFADYNNDGWLDIYATTGFMSFNRRKPDG